MEERIYKHIIKIQSPESMIKVLKNIDKIYNNNIKLVVENAHYYFEDKQGNVVTFDSTDEFLDTFRNHKGVKKLYNKLLSDEKNIIRSCIKLAGNLDNALNIYYEYKHDLVDYDNSDEVIKQSVIGTQLFPVAYCEYLLFMSNKNILNLDKYFSCDNNNRINGLFSLDDIDDKIWKRYLTDDDVNETDNWFIAHKRLINELLDSKG